MPMLKTVMPETQIATSLELQEALASLDVTRNQFVTLHRTIASYLPAIVTMEQRTPKSVVTVTLRNHDATYKFRVNNRSKVSLLSMND